MSGVQLMAAGAVLILFSTAGLISGEWILKRKKKQIREQTYQIYD